MANEFFQILNPSGMTDQRMYIQNEGSASLILSGYDRATNFDFADRYRVTVNSIDRTSKKIAVSVASDTLHSPFVNPNISDILADASTYVDDLIIPGFGFKFADADTLSVGQSANIYIGDLLVDGTITAGDPSDADGTVEKLGVKNLHSTRLSGCKAAIVAKPRPRNVNGKPIVAAKCTSAWSRDSVDLIIRFNGYIPGSNQICQIDNGSNINIQCDSTSWNEIAPGLMVVFNDSASITAIDVAVIRITDGYRYVQLAPNDDGTPGIWTNGTVHVIQDGLLPGMINSEEMGHFWKRVSPGLTATPAGNPREYQLLVQGDITS